MRKKYKPGIAARGRVLLALLRHRLRVGARREALATAVFEIGEWANTAPAPHETVERAATLIRVYAERFEKLAAAADLILAGEEENIPCSDAARPLWLAVSEAAGMAEELRELTRNPPPALDGETPEWLERAMDRALAAVSTKH